MAIHLDEMRLQLRELQALKKEQFEALFARIREARKESQAAREAAGDFSTPMERLRSRMLAEGVIETATTPEE